MKPQSQRQHHGESGFASRELAILVSILSIFVVVIVHVTRLASRSERYATDTRKAQVIDQGILDEMRLDLAGAVRMFDSGRQSTDLLSRLAFPDGVAPIPLSNLPRLQREGLFECERMHATRTGNVLMFLVHHIQLVLVFLVSHVLVRYESVAKNVKLNQDNINRNLIIRKSVNPFPSRWEWVPATEDILRVPGSAPPLRHEYQRSHCK